MIELGRPMFVSVSGVDVTSHVATIRFEHPISIETWQMFVMPPLRLRFRGRGTALTPVAYRWLLKRSHPRIRRMHTAYGRKRGRGRW